MCLGAAPIFPGEEKSMIEITNQLSIPYEALKFTASLSRGQAGGMLIRCAAA